MPRYTTPWDPDSVLNYIKALGMNDQMTLPHLTRKFTMLMLLLSGQRCQTLHLLKITDLTMTASTAVFRITSLLKTSRPGHHFSELTFNAYDIDTELCIHKTLTSYLDRTSEAQGPITSLFLTTKRPIKAASRDSIRRWTREVMAAAGLDMSIFSAHSTRSASTSRAASKLPLDTIVMTVGWSSTSVFAKYYQRPVLDTPTPFADAILVK